MSKGTEGTCAGAQEDHFVCKDCGPHTKADEDGCCAYCGRDCTVEPCRPSQRGPSAPIELNADEAERSAKMPAETHGVAEPRRVRHIIGRVRHESTARACAGYIAERWSSGIASYEYNEGEKWWFVILTPYDEYKITNDDSGRMCEAVRAFAAGRKSMVD